MSIDKSKGIIALKVLNANQPDMFLCVMDDKLVKLSKATSGSNRHHFSIRFPEEKEAATLNFVSFESVAFPNWYLRHQGFELKISEAVPNARMDIVYRQDASWLFESLTTQSSTTLKGNCLESTQILTTENSLISNNKIYNLVLQKDGSLCVFQNKSSLVWSSGTQNKGGVKLIMQKDGNLCIITNNMCTSGGQIPLATKDPDLYLKIVES
ncbi:MAG: AbfB domain-containing protein [Saprospiraceae bacterium]|nr:AbfB domain-containing protein [Saprospiraceae bacterium]